MLANQTEKVAVEIAFRARRSVAGAFAPIAEAWHEVGSVFATSIAALITCAAAVIPWLIIVVPVVWLLLRYRRNRRRRRFSPAPAG